VVLRWISGFVWLLSTGGWAPVVMGWIAGFFWLLSTDGWAPVVMGWVAGCLRAFRRVCRRLFCGGLCMSFIRRAYLHTTSSVLVHRATVSVAPAICGYEWCVWFACLLFAFPAWLAWCVWCSFPRSLRGMRCASRVHALRAALPRAMRVLTCKRVMSGGARVLRGTLATLPTRGSFFPDAAFCFCSSYPLSHFCTRQLIAGIQREKSLLRGPP
jgi:hypothetical protein